MDRTSLWMPLVWLALMGLGDCAPALAQIPQQVSDVNGDGRIVVACLGDSNTDPVFNARLPGGSWCEHMAPDYGSTVEVHNFGAGGGTIACDFPLAVSLAAHQLDDAIAADADAVVLAFITNDVRYALGGSCTPPDPTHQANGRLITAEQIDRELSRQIHALVRTAKTAHFWILLAPPALPPDGDIINAKIFEINQRLTRRYARSRRVGVIEHPSLEPGDYADSLHLNETGQKKRAQAVHAALFGW